MTVMEQDPPDDLQERDVESDDELLAEEKELIITCPNDVDWCYVYSDIPTYIKWLLSVVDERDVEIEQVRTDDAGDIVACWAKVPRGIIKLQGSARKSDQPSDMVSYGDAR